MHSFDMYTGESVALGAPLDAETPGEFADLAAAARVHEAYDGFKERLRANGISVRELSQRELCALFLMDIHQQAGLDNFDPGELYG